MVLGGVGGTRRKLQFCDSPPHQSQLLPPPAAAAIDLSNNSNSKATLPFPAPSAAGGVKLRCCSTDHSNDKRLSRMDLRDTCSANLPGDRFLDWIRKVDKLIVEELRRAKQNNPSRNKRDRRMRILMSMR